MSPRPEPLHRTRTSAGRLVATAGAALVTLLTLAGQLGVGPGAAQAQQTEDTRAQASDAATKQPVSKPHVDPDATEQAGSGQPVDDDWLTIDDPTGDAADVDDSKATGPALPRATGTGKRIVYDISAQRVWLVTGTDDVKRTYLVSGGKDESLLDPGRYRVYSMSREATSYNQRETMQYMVRFATGDRAPIGFHDVPARADGSLVQSRSELGTPLSAGCIRQWITDARALWEFAAVDTPVVVTA